MKKLILMLAGGLYCLILYLSVVQVYHFGALNIEIFAIFSAVMLGFTFYLPVRTEFRYAVAAHLLVIASVSIPTDVYDMTAAKTIPYGYPFRFMTQDHTEWLEVSVHDGGAHFPYTEIFYSVGDRGLEYMHMQINYWAMLSSWLVVFLLLLIARLIFKKIAHLRH
jgi:hypothetical protein